MPSTWEKSDGQTIRFKLSIGSDEYNSIATTFDQAMRGQYKRIKQIERIQNERCYIQYLAHSQYFQKCHNRDTERRLYHGCPEQAVDSILKDCFNRSFAGVNGISKFHVFFIEACSIVIVFLGTSYGVGVYFSSNAAYSHGYTEPNVNGERHMLVARVLIGNTVKGNSSMKTRPVGYDSTTDGSHIFVTYHDAQTYAEYLITYK